MAGGVTELGKVKQNPHVQRGSLGLAGQTCETERAKGAAQQQQQQQQRGAAVGAASGQEPSASPAATSPLNVKTIVRARREQRTREVGFSEWQSTIRATCGRLP